MEVSLGIMILPLCMFSVLRSEVVVDYCKLKCQNNEENTMCKFPKPGPGPDCKGFFGDDLTDEEKQFILEYHNNARDYIAGGGFKSKGLPPAANMMELVWDPELAEIAKRWTEQCIFDHDGCRASSKFPEVGQNLVLKITEEPENDTKELLLSLMDALSQEVMYLNPEDISSYSSRPNTGRYAQMVWAKTTNLGCSTSKTLFNNTYRYTLICNYGPEGSKIGFPVYEIERLGLNRSRKSKGRGLYKHLHSGTLEEGGEPEVEKKLPRFKRKDDANGLEANNTLLVDAENKIENEISKLKEEGKVNLIAVKVSESPAVNKVKEVGNKIFNPELPGSIRELTVKAQASAIEKVNVVILFVFSVLLKNYIQIFL